MQEGFEFRDGFQLGILVVECRTELIRRDNGNGEDTLIVGSIICMRWKEFFG